MAFSTLNTGRFTREQDATPKEKQGSRDDYVIFRRLPTRWSDNDIYGHMNNVIHYFMFDTAINEWLIENDCLDPKSGKQVGLVVSTGCTYFSQISFPDIVNVGIRVAKLGNSSVRYELGIFRNEDDSASAEGFFTHVYVDRESHKPEPLNPKLRRLLETAVPVA